MKSISWLSNVIYQMSSSSFFRKLIILLSFSFVWLFSSRFRLFYDLFQFCRLFSKAESIRWTIRCMTKLITSSIVVIFIFINLNCEDIWFVKTSNFTCLLFFVLNNHSWDLTIFELLIWIRRLTTLMTKNTNFSNLMKWKYQTLCSCNHQKLTIFLFSINVTILQ